MTPIVNWSDPCHRCGQRPAHTHHICRACEQLLRAFGHDPALLEPERVTSSHDPGFDLELRQWLEAG